MHWRFFLHITWSCFCLFIFACPLLTLENGKKRAVLLVNNLSKASNELSFPLVVCIIPVKFGSSHLSTLPPQFTQEQSLQQSRKQMLHQTSMLVVQKVFKVSKVWKHFKLPHVKGYFKRT